MTLDTLSTEVFHFGKGRGGCHFLRTAKFPGEWWIRPCPVPFLITCCHGIRMLSSSDSLKDKRKKPPVYWSWSDCKRDVSDIMGAEMIQIIDAMIADLETVYGKEIDTTQTEGSVFECASVKERAAQIRAGVKA